MYQQAIDIVDTMFITLIEKEITGDTYFPDFDESKFTKEIVEISESVIPYQYLTYTRK